MGYCKIRDESSGSVLDQSLFQQFILSFSKHKPDPSSEAAFQKLRAKIADLENEKAVAQSKMDQMQLEMCNETEAFIKERDGLQAEVTQLRLLIEDLMTQVGEHYGTFST